MEAVMNLKRGHFIEAEEIGEVERQGMPIAVATVVGGIVVFAVVAFASVTFGDDAAGAIWEWAAKDGTVKCVVRETRGSPWTSCEEVDPARMAVLRDKLVTMAPLLHPSVSAPPATVPQAVAKQ
jgi:hypothetical protein